MRAAGWHFAPSGSARPTRESIGAAAAAGPAALSRDLREARRLLGAMRAVALLQAAETAAGHRFGRPMALLLVTTHQPRSLADALTLGFAIAGYALTLTSIEGVPEWRTALAVQPASPSLQDDPADGNTAMPWAGIRMTLVSMPDDGASPGRDALLAALAEETADRTLAPVAIARFRLPNAPAPVRADGAGVGLLDIPVATILDQRFASFGAILTAEAAERLADAAAGFAARRDGAAPKLVITDLDGTLWEGVLGEGGSAEEAGDPAAGASAGLPQPADAISLNRAYAEALATLRDRGLVLAIASRNDPADVDAALASAAPLGAEAFAACAVGWADKPTLVAEVLAKLGLAPEHALFVDDDPVNCAAVSARFPGMDVRHVGGDRDAFAAELVADPLLAGGGGAERAAQYARRTAVERLRDDAVDEAAFLASLRTAVTVLPLDAALRPRAAELASRVNQFLLTGLRPNALQLAARPVGFDLMVRLDDAFGAHGLVGLVLASRQGDDLMIDNLFLSCRALQRGVEGAMLRAMAQRARRAGLRRIVGRIEVLPRNEPSRGVLAAHGFVEADGQWIYDLAGGPLAVVPEGLELIDAAGEFS